MNEGAQWIGGFGRVGFVGYCAWCDARGIGLWETQGWFVQCLLRVALLSRYVVGGAL